MTSTAAKGKVSVEELMKDAALLRDKAKAAQPQAEVKQEAATTAFADIQSNTFYKLMFSAATPEEKKNALAAALVYDSTKTKQENATRMEDFAKFKEYVHFERKRMAQEIIKLTDTDTMGELKAVVEEMNTALLDFNGEITPLMEILDAVYEVNKAGGETVQSVFEQIAEDKKREKELADQRRQQEEQLRRDEEEIRRLRDRNIELAQKKSLFGFGGIKADAKAEIALNEARLSEKQEDLADLAVKIKETAAAQTATSSSSEFAAQKEQIRKLLDISTDEHKARTEKLVDKANTYIDTSYERTTSVLDGLRRLSGQINNLGDANSGMYQVFAVISDGMKDAEKKNEEIRSSLDAAPADESAIAKMQREQKRLEIEEYIGLSMHQSADNVQAIQSITNEALQIKAMRDSNSRGIANAQTLSSSGVSGIASQLATVLQGVSAASLEQSTESASLNIQNMNRINEMYLKKSVMQSAMGVYKENEELTKTIARLQETGTFLRDVNSATRTGIAELRDNLNKVEEAAKSMKKDVDDAVGISADTIRDDLNKAARGDAKAANSNNPAAATPEKAPVTSPFGNIGRGPA